VVNKPLKTPPSYAIASVDHALRAAAMLQLEDGLTVSQVAERLGVARSTAHRLLAMLVYRDFAVQDDDRVYRAGPVLELAAHSQSRTSMLRATRISSPYSSRPWATRPAVWRTTWRRRGDGRRNRAALGRPDHRARDRPGRGIYLAADVQPAGL
jgi:hypothetical protein